MRCHYLSDLHLEAQSFDTPLPKGDVLIIAGDICHARCLEPSRTDRYSFEQRERTLRFIDQAIRHFAHVLLIAGNHEHYDGVFEDTTGLLRRHLPGVIVLDNQSIDIDGVRFFGSTLWSDFNSCSPAVMDAVRRRMGEYFFVKTRTARNDGVLARFQPETALLAHQSAWKILQHAVTAEAGKTTVVVTHHAPSRLGLNPRFSGTTLDAAYASSLDHDIAAFTAVPIWVHGHTHVARTYRIANTIVHSNALGFASKGHGAAGFSVGAKFEIQ